MNWRMGEHNPIWFLEEDRQQYPDQGWPRWYIVRGYPGYYIYDYASFRHSSYPDLEAAKFALLVLRAAVDNN